MHRSPKPGSTEEASISPPMPRKQARKSTTFNDIDAGEYRRVPPSVPQRAGSPSPRLHRGSCQSPWPLEDSESTKTQTSSRKRIRILRYIVSTCRRRHQRSRGHVPRRDPHHTAGRRGMLVSFHMLPIPLHYQTSTRNKAPTPHSIDSSIVSPSFVSRPEFDDLHAAFQESEIKASVELSVRITIFLHSS